MTLIRKKDDGFIYMYTEALANQPGFEVIDDEAPAVNKPTAADAVAAVEAAISRKRTTKAKAE